MRRLPPLNCGNRVAPFTGAWIEMMEPRMMEGDVVVAPFTGAWIEIYYIAIKYKDEYRVAPFTGAWIEICFIGAL